MKRTQVTTVPFLFFPSSIGSLRKLCIIDYKAIWITNCSLAVFSVLDFKKAFDTVDHSFLLSKLYHYGIRGPVNEWFSSYLNSRVQTTQIDKQEGLNGVYCLAYNDGFLGIVTV